MGLSDGEKARLGDAAKDPEGILHHIPLELTIAAMDKETAAGVAVGVITVLNSQLQEARQQGTFLNVLWEPIEVKVVDGE